MKPHKKQYGRPRPLSEYKEPHKCKWCGQEFRYSMSKASHEAHCYLKGIGKGDEDDNQRN